MEDFESYEYVIKPQKTKKDTLKKVILIIFYISYIVAWLIFGFVTAMIPLLALVPVTLWIIIFFTWRYVKIEYEYVAESGIITISKVFDNRSKKEAFSFDIRSAELIAPTSDKNTQRAVEDYDPKYEYFFNSSNDSKDSFTILIVNDDNERCSVNVTATDKLKKSFKFYNSNALKIHDNNSFH